MLLKPPLTKEQEFLYSARQSLNIRGLMRKIILTALLATTPFFAFAGTKGIKRAESPEPLDFVIATKKPPAFITCLQEIALESNGVKIGLSDSSQWLIEAEDPAALLTEIAANWKVGEDIRIDNPPKEDFFVLKSVANPSFYQAELIQKAENAQYRIEKVDRNGYVIMSNDGSQWVVGWIDSFASSRWRVGDVLTINKSSFSRKEDYLLIHHATGKGCWVTLISWK